MTGQEMMITPSAPSHVVEPQPATIDRLFVYGTLLEPQNFQLIAGQMLPTEKAVLSNHRRIHPQNGYPFAIPWPGANIDGEVISGVTPEMFKKIDDYESEGLLYLRKIVHVQVGEQTIETYTYIGIPEAIEPYFTRGLERRERIEEFIEKRVHRYLKTKAFECGVTSRKTLSLQVTQEFLSEEVHALVRQYFHDIGLPPFIIKHELEKANLPSLDWLRLEPKAEAYADHYMTLAVKFMIFNQIEERFRREFRAQVKVSNAYYMHTISAMMALKLLVAHYQHLQVAMAQIGVNRYNPTFTYVDYAVAAIFIAEDLYTPLWAEEVVEWMKLNRHPGRLPLGAELEFSNMGFQAVTAQEGEDHKFDNFYYFYDFDLMRRGWKLGTHVDDHGFLTAPFKRSRGFLEMAFGRCSLFGDVSKPATLDPWILAQLIDLAIRYIGIKPHSLHISLQTAPNTHFRKIKHPDDLLCLLLLGGDLRQDDQQQLREMRIYQGEIIHAGRVYFSRFNRHHKEPDETSWSFVMEYQFPRLSFDADYQPLILALKGFQMAANPYPLQDAPDCPYQEAHRDIERLLIQWASAPTPISQASIARFLTVIQKGLEQEAAVVGEHYKAYTQRMLQRIEEQLKRRNKRIQQYYANRQRQSYSSS